MQIILTENEIKNAIVMFLQSKMSIDDTVDVELSTQGRGGQTVVATVDLDSVAKNPSKTSQDEPKKEENTDTLPEVEKAQEEAADVNSESLFNSEPEKEKEPVINSDDSPFGSFA